MIRFDTLDKKPKLYDLIVLTLVYAAALGIMAAIDLKGLSAPMCITTMVFLALVIARLVTAFIGQLRYNPYSYNTIYYIGFALFLTFVLITHATLLYRMLTEPEAYGSEQLLYIFLDSAKSYMIYTSPFILVFSLALFVSNISLLRHERKRFVNVLGILLALLLIGGVAFLFRYDYYVSGSQFEVMIHDLIGNTFAAIYLYFECMLIGAIIANVIVVKYEPERDKDFLIILGCGLRRDGTPTPLLAGRIERALAFYEKQKAETGKELTFIASGGQGPAEANSESLAIKRCLMERGVPEERIIEEDKSTDTLENMRYSKEKILERDPSAKAAFSTTNYHVFRAGISARRVKLRAVGMGARTKWYFWPNAAVREFVGLLSEHRLKQGIILGSIVAVYIVLTLIIYHS